MRVFKSKVTPAEKKSDETVGDLRSSFHNWNSHRSHSNMHSIL